MTRENTPDADDDREGLEEEAFRSELRTLVREAHRSDIRLERHWDCRTGETGPDWEVEIVRVAACDGESD